MISGISVDEEFPLRFIIYHLNPASARLRFLKSSDGQVCHPLPLPRLSDLIDHYSHVDSVTVHPASYLQAISKLLSTSIDKLVIEDGFRCWIDTPQQVLPVYLLRVNSQSPCAAPKDYQWIELPDSFSLTEIERNMMRHCYQRLME